MTIYDIAELAGVSASTVSRVINNKPGIKASTREKVKALLKEHNYTPDENARGLVNKNTRLIGILLADIRSAHHTDLTYA
ncbi:MAG: helix-turn-helix domain-containing protein, partial [Schaedlerella sp.]|uniref:LacI family DNA-binding transcriptional regulator n=1 Tax=Schaedlerella sp. TaxID=2676057 RepID=UPI0035274E8A